MFLKSNIFSRLEFRFCLIAFTLANLALYLFVSKYNNSIPFNDQNYTKNSHHYFEDLRAKGGEFNLLRSLGQYDAQWYLKISDSGYPNNPTIATLDEKRTFDGSTYAFFPLYPLLLSILNVSIGNIEITAFLFSNFLLLLNFVSLYFVLSKLIKEKIALKTIFLLFFFPFSIFYRSYFTEGLLLFEIIWFSYFLIKKRHFPASIIAGLLCITRGTGLFLLPVLACFVFKDRKSITIKQLLIYIFAATIPLALWIIYNSIQTGDPFYFIEARRAWFSFPIPILYNLAHVATFFSLPLHAFHYSQIDVLVISVNLLILLVSKKKMKPELWWIAFALFLGPLLTTDTMSFTRYQTISYPVFLYSAQTLNGYKYWVILALFTLGLFITSILFVNWYWIG